MSKENLEKIKARIRALLAKTESNGATKAEAEAALAKVTELMTQYMINEADIADNKRKFITKTCLVMGGMEDVTRLAPNLCELFSCQHFYTRKAHSRQIDKLYYFGTEMDVDCCIYFTNLISNTLFNEIIKYRKTPKYWELAKSFSPQAIKKDFQNGFIIGVGSKIESLIQEKKSNVIKSTGKDLVLVKDQEVKDAFSEMSSDIKEVKPRRRHYNSEAVFDGIEKGEQINLAYGLNKTSDIKQIGG